VNAHKNLIHVLFDDCLFAVPSRETQKAGSQQPPKCKSKAARTAAFRLLVELARGCTPNFRILLEKLNGQLASIISSSSILANRNTASRSTSGYVGLQNQGATCYMNSTMQQLYLIEPFRRGILSAFDSADDKSESLLYHIQYMFCFLQESFKRYYDTTKFCRTIKDETGQPVNTRVQMDANEYFNKLFDRIENILEGTPQANLVKEVFGGTLTNQLLPQGCEHSSERDEPFYALSIDVKNKKNLQEALELFVEGETLSDDNAVFCEGCQKKLDTVKRCCIKTLPPVMFVQLKRFDFDFAEMRRLKLNHRVEFPMTVNMEPYTREGLFRRDTTDALRASGQIGMFEQKPDEYYTFHLSGIVVHSGSANSGHYYSFIKEPYTPVGQEAKWFEYNDTRVSPFDLSRLEKDCFGGVDTFKVRDKETGKLVEQQRARINNAYMLVYQRADVADKPHWEVPSLAATDSISINQATHTVMIGEQKNLNTNNKSTTDGVNVIDENSSDNKSTTDDTNVSDVIDKSSKKSKKSSDKSTTDENNKSSDNKSTTDDTNVSDVIDKSSKKSKKSSDKSSKKKKSSSSSTPIPLTTDEMCCQIWKENQDFVRSRMIFSPEYLDFVWNFLSLYPKCPDDYQTIGDFDPGMSTTTFGTKFFMEVYLRGEIRSNLGTWTEHIAQLYRGNYDACVWLIKQLCRQPKLIIQQLIENTTASGQTRSSFVSLIQSALITLADIEREHYDAEKKALEGAKLNRKFNKKHKPVSYVIWFIESYLSLLMDKTVRRKSQATSQYFLMLQRFAEIGPVECQYLLDKSLLTTLIQFFMSKGHFEPPVASSSNGKGAPVGMEGLVNRGMVGIPVGLSGFSGGFASSSHLRHLVGTVCTLVTACPTAVSDRKGLPPTFIEQLGGSRDAPRLKMTKSDRSILFARHGRQFWEKVIRERIAMHPVEQVFMHLAWEDREHSRTLMEVTLRAMAKASRFSFSSYFPMLSTLQDIDDSFQQWRVDYLMIKASVILKDKATHNDTRKDIKAFLDRRSQSNQHVKHWMASNEKWVVADLEELLVPEPPRQVSGVGSSRIYKRPITTWHR